MSYNTPLWTEADAEVVWCLLSPRRGLGKEAVTNSTEECGKREQAGHTFSSLLVAALLSTRHVGQMEARQTFASAIAGMQRRMVSRW